MIGHLFIVIENWFFEKNKKRKCPCTCCKCKGTCHTNTHNGKCKGWGSCKGN